MLVIWTALSSAENLEQIKQKPSFRKIDKVGKVSLQRLKVQSDEN
jgi:hypothetical protein